MNSFAEKVVLVTGATRGIGRATTIAFAREGGSGDSLHSGLQAPRYRALADLLRTCNLARR